MVSLAVAKVESVTVTTVLLSNAPPRLAPAVAVFPEKVVFEMLAVESAPPPSVSAPPMVAF